jgi:hypothetical protein
MKAIVQVEFRERVFSVRDEILQSLGYPVISALVVRLDPMVTLIGLPHL